jgi:NAD(P)-dependent dehydrogenase (short-subunit alcohol dehydrogenase family)
MAASGGPVVFVATHVEQEAEVAAFMQSAVDHFGQLNILVHNAGIRMYHTVVEASAESWNTILGVNLLGYVFGAKAAIPFMRQAGGRRIAAAGKTLDEYRAEASARTMLKRPGTPQEVAACVLFLASEEASYVTGTLSVRRWGLHGPLTL